MPRQGYVPDAICREFVNRDPKDHLIEGTVGSVDTNQPVAFAEAGNNLSGTLTVTTSGAVTADTRGAASAGIGSRV